jgi:serine phosphatase RsbU (regulator of sigma subunit)
MLKYYNKVVDSLIPSNLPSGVEYERKAKLIAHSVILGTIFSSTFIPVYYLLDFSEAIWTVVFLMVGFIMSGLVFRFSRNFIISGNIFAYSCYASMLCIAIYSNGIYSPTIPYLIAAVVSAFWYANKISGYIWTGIVILTCVALVANQDAGGGHFTTAYNMDFQQIFYGLALAGIFVYILIVVVTYERSRDNAFKKLNNAYAEINYQHEELKQQTEEIEQQRDLLNDRTLHLESAYTQITDSVRYAKRIQNSVLGSSDSMENYFSESFKLLMPRDIVSGDFYWIGERGGKMIIIAADCTGHGVPGAFMTILGHSIFNEVINEKEICQPDQILTQANKILNKALKSSGNANVYDGMDAVVVSVDKEKQLLQYAGAKNPLYHFHNSGYDKIKGSKFPIGTLQYKGEVVYELHEINYEKDDVIYLTSDGYQDQFGGENSRKYMVKRFYRYLDEIHHLPLIRQKEKLVHEFINWRGDAHNQTDDVLIIGIKL